MHEFEDLRQAAKLGANRMPEAPPLILHQRAELYATRAAVVEVLRYLSQADPRLVAVLRANVARRPLPLNRPSEDVGISDGQVRDCLEHLLGEVDKPI